LKYSALLYATPTQILCVSIKEERDKEGREKEKEKEKGRVKERS
jgi:hypothetical protein